LSYSSSESTLLIFQLSTELHVQVRQAMKTMIRTAKTAWDRIPKSSKPMIPTQRAIILSEFSQFLNKSYLFTEIVWIGSFPVAKCNNFFFFFKETTSIFQQFHIWWNKMKFSLVLSKVQLVVNRWISIKKPIVFTIVLHYKI
jgi:hypothetical protein